jgi:hypothetical protein
MYKAWQLQCAAALLGCVLAAAAGTAPARAGDAAGEQASAEIAPPPRIVAPRIVPPRRASAGFSGSSAARFRVHPPGRMLPRPLSLAPRPYPTSAGGG